MDQGPLVGVMGAQADLPHQRGNGGKGQLMLFEKLVQWHAGHVLHGEEQRPIGQAAGIVDLGDGAMRKLRQCLAFNLEIDLGERVVLPARQQLDRYLAL